MVISFFNKDLCYYRVSLSCYAYNVFYSERLNLTEGALQNKNAMSQTVQILKFFASKINQSWGHFWGPFHVTLLRVSWNGSQFPISSTNDSQWKPLGDLDSFPRSVKQVEIYELVHNKLIHLE